MADNPYEYDYASAVSSQQPSSLDTPSEEVHYTYATPSSEQDAYNYDRVDLTAETLKGR